MRHPNEPRSIYYPSDYVSPDEFAEYVPTYENCVKLGIYPKRVIDVVLTHKGTPQWFIEICHTNPTSTEKIEELQSLGVRNLIEIDADWILNQTKRPTQLIYETLIDCCGNILQHGHIMPIIQQSRIYLTVPDEYKCIPKRFGALWDKKLKTWYIFKGQTSLFKCFIDKNRIHLDLPYELLMKLKH